AHGRGPPATAWDRALFAALAPLHGRRVVGTPALRDQRLLVGSAAPAAPGLAGPLGRPVAAGGRVHRRVGARRGSRAGAQRPPRRAVPLGAGPGRGLTHRGGVAGPLPVRRAGSPT